MGIFTIGAGVFPASHLMKNTLTLAIEPDSDQYGLYDENSKLITNWQSGDCPTSIFKRIFNHYGKNLIRNDTIMQNREEFPPQI